jgi:predicted small lipoprotein YifL
MRICWAQYTLWAVIVVLGLLSMLAGCGSKGDLYLPEPEQQAPPQQTEQPKEEQ